jgi:hypothetical protein
MLGRRDLGIRLQNLPVGTYDVSDALGRLRVGRIARAVGYSDLPFLVAEQRKGIPEFSGKRRVVFDRVEGGAEDLDVALLKFAVKVAEPATLLGSTGGVRLRVEPEDHGFSAIVGKAAGFSRVVLNGEIGSLIAYLEHGCLLAFSSQLSAVSFSVGRAPLRADS